MVLEKVIRDEQVSLEPLRGKTISVIGYGIQGRAQALNLRDSGLKVIIGLRRDSPSRKSAEEEGFEVVDVPTAAEQGDVVMMLIPDMSQKKVWEESVRGHIRDGAALDFAHGFNIFYKLIQPPETIDVIMVAPKAPGRAVREEFQRGRGVPAVVAVEQNATGRAWDITLALAKGIGCTRAGVIKTTFKEETETDLIGEQTVLVGGLMQLIKLGFENLVELGYQPEVAYYEVLNEAKLIMDLIWSRGITGMLNGVSVTARYGGLAVGPQVLDEKVKENMRKAAERVRSGEFTREWLEEYGKGMPNLKRMLKEMEEHEIENVGREMRKIIFGEEKGS